LRREKVRMDDKYKSYALSFKALSDENRLLILDYLIGGEQCACRILEQLNITQPTLSHHMRILCESGIVKARKDGKWMHYSLNSDKAEALKEFLSLYAKAEPGRSGSCQ
jgi:ArsR family transcriptional regulator